MNKPRVARILYLLSAILFVAIVTCVASYLWSPYTSTLASIGFTFWWFTNHTVPFVGADPDWTFGARDIGIVIQLALAPFLIALVYVAPLLIAGKLIARRSDSAEKVSQKL